MQSARNAGAPLAQAGHMRFARALKRSVLAAGALLATAGAAATWTACGDSDALPTGSWNGGQGLGSPEGGGGGEADASVTGPTSDSDSGIGATAEQDGGMMRDGAHDGSGGGKDA